MSSPLFLMWYDDSTKISSTEKATAAIAAYSARFGGIKPNLVLVNEREQFEISGVVVRPLVNIPPNNYWVAFERAVVS